jgi:probable rRNA maturation factor
MKVELSVSHQEDNSESDSSVPLSYIQCFEKVFCEELARLDQSLSRYPVIEVSLTVVSEKIMKDLNMEYRGIDKPTDVLSFPLWENSGTFDPPYEWQVLPLGDILFCPAVLGRQDFLKENGSPLDMETIISHGFLHLLGWDHAEAEEEKKMEEEQENIANRVHQCVKAARGQDYGNEEVSV